MIFRSLVQDLFRVAEAEPPQDLAEDIDWFQYHDGDFTCVIYSESDSNWITLQVRVGSLETIPDDRVSDILRLMHRLNALVMSRTQVVASLSVDDEIFVAKVLDASILDGRLLAAEIGVVLGAASDLLAALDGVPATGGMSEAFEPKPGSIPA